jgi:uncharacterized protein
MKTQFLNRFMNNYIVLDTNIFVSLFVYNSGVMKELLEQSLVMFEVIIDHKLENEINDLLLNRFKISHEKQYELRRLLDRFTIVDTVEIENLESDPKDAFLLDLISQHHAKYLITGDKKHLLPIGNFKGTEILSPRQFLDLFE